MRNRNLPLLLLALVLASTFAAGCARRGLTKSEMDRADAIAAKIARAETMDAVNCAPKELAVAKAALAHARHEAAERHERAEEFFAEADRAADALLARTIPCWEARQVKPALAPAPPAPAARLSADPGTIEKGACSTLSWSTTGAETAVLNRGIGGVSTSGNRQVCPPETIVYTLTATGPGGSADASATIEVLPPPPAPEKPTAFDDIHFDFDQSFIREDAKPVLEKVAAYIKANPGATLLIEGHCDERGTSEYNLALGERRASAAARYLRNLGVGEHRLSEISYGEERPADPGHDEEAWAKNRRAVFVLK